MNSRKRYNVEVDRLSRIEEDLERLSLCGDSQPTVTSVQLVNSQHLQQQVQDKLLESIPVEQHLMVERSAQRDDKLLQHLQQQQLMQQQFHQQQMLKQIHAHQMGYPDSIRSKHLQQESQPISQQIDHRQQTNRPGIQYCRIEHGRSEIANPLGNHYQHLADFQSGRMNLDQLHCSHHATVEQKNALESPDGPDGAKFLKEKYDSLGKVKVPKPQGTSNNFNGQDRTQQEHDRSSNQFQVLVGAEGACQNPFAHFDGQQREQFHEVHYFHGPRQRHDAVHAGGETTQEQENQWRQHYDRLPTKEEQVVASEERDRATSSRQQNLKPQQPQERHLLNEHDLMQVDIFYRSQRSKIFVSRCCANLMMGPQWSFQSTGSLGGSPASGVRQLCRNFRDWACVKSGVPVLVLDTSKNELCIILAEHGSGFALWRNRMGPLTGYSVIAADFHALRTDPSMQRSLANNSSSTLVTSIVGLNFVDAEAAEEFYKNVVTLSTLASSLGSVATSNRNRHVSGDALNDSQQRDHGLSNSTQDLQASGINKQNGERTKNSKKSKRSFSKTDISQPCCFSHVTKLGDRFRDGSSRLFLTTSDTNVLVRGTATIDKKSALHRLQSGLKQKH